MSKSRATKPHSVSDDEIMRAVREAIADGARDGGDGGVHPQRLEDYCALAASTLIKRCGGLADDGRLTRVNGWGPSYQPRLSFLPTDHEDAPGREDDKPVWEKQP